MNGECAQVLAILRIISLGLKYFEFILLDEQEVALNNKKKTCVNNSKNINFHQVLDTLTA